MSGRVRSGRSASPRWGQNFLVDKNVAERIVDWADIDGRSVVEIGPGKGALTEMLMARASHLALVEIDPELVARWRERFGDSGKVAVHHADAVEFSLAEVSPRPVHVVSNLPYESGTAIVRNLLAQPGDMATATIMLQREVCRRLAAGVGDGEYGLLGIHTQLLADVELGRSVPPSCFRPAPKVDSQVARLVVLPEPRFEVGDLATFSRITKTAFAQRRKMLRNTLMPVLASALGRDGAEAALEAAGVRDTDRPENVDLEAYAKLSAACARAKGNAGA